LWPKHWMTGYATRLSFAKITSDFKINGLPRGL